MKVLLIVFGSLFGLMVIAIVGIAIMIPILGKKLIADSNNPVTRAHTLAKIADFRLPAGYTVSSVTDMGFSQAATISSSAAGRATSIQLTAQHLPSADTEQSLDAMSTGFDLTAKLLRCDLKRGADDKVVSAHGTSTLRSFSCTNSGAMHVEVGFVSAKASTVQVVATATGGPFDKAAVDALVSSIR